MRRLLACTLLLVACGPANRPRVAAVATRPAAARDVLALPGPCVDPEADALTRFGPDADREGAHIERTVDLDGDGTLDPMVTHASFCGTGGCNWQLYVARGECAHHVGELFGLLPTARTDVTSGLVELEIAARDGCGGMARTELRARFDGHTYVPAETRKCRCPEPSDDAVDDADPEKWCDPWRPAGTAE